MDRLTSMAVFVKVIEVGSLTGAARKLRLSQAMVSKHIRALEQQLGVKLLNLTTRRLALTEPGRLYLERCQQILREVDEAAQEAAQHHSTPRGLLRLTAPATFGELHLAPAIADFMGAYPEISVDAEFTDRFVNLTEEGFDVALRIGRLEDSSLVARKLGESAMLTCAAPSYLARTGEPGHPSELSGRPCLYLASAATPGIWWYREKNGEPLQVRVEGRLRSNSMALLARLAVQGTGIVFGPGFVLEPLVRAKRLRPILTAYPSAPLDITALMPAGRRLSTKVRVFVDFLAERFRQWPQWESAL